MTVSRFKLFAPLSTLHYLWFDMQHDFVCTRWILDPLGPHTPWPYPKGLHQNSECISPVLICRAITYDSFKILAQKRLRGVVWQSKNRIQNPTFWPLVTPRHALGQNFFLTVFYSSLLHFCSSLLFIFASLYSTLHLGPRPLGLREIDGRPGASTA